MLDLSKSKKVTAVLNFKLNFLPRGSTKYLLEVKNKFTFFNALNDGIDQTFRTFFY